MIIRRTTAAAILILCASTAWAAPVSSNEKVVRELPILIGGTLILDNPVGDIDITGTDDTKVTMTVEKYVRAADAESLAEGKDQTQLALLGGDRRLVQVKTLVPPIHSGRWNSGMNYVVRVPRTVHVKVMSSGVSRIRVSDMRGSVAVKIFNGAVLLERLLGTASVDSANSDVVFIAPDHGLGDAALSAVNGSIQVVIPAGTRFRWQSETFKGESKTTFPLKGAFIGTTFRGNINGDGGPLIVTQSLMGNVFMMEKGSKIASARRVIPVNPEVPIVQMNSFTTQSVNGFFRYATSHGDIRIGEIHGSADLSTGSGDVSLGAVFGDLQVVSKGGPLDFGQIGGSVSARTEVGDVRVDSVKNGGTLITGGGTIRVTETGGEMRLQSGGGDIVVLKASGPITADTQSGDITITIDPASRSERITAKTAKGNVILNVLPGFGADIDATVLTADPDVNNILSDLAGLQFRREQVGGKTKIRATGRVNGGGERLELYAEDGGIQIITRNVAPITAPSP
jgi:DUF4097 and DUF4098 domain-containing protein YvlB